MLRTCFTQTHNLACQYEESSWTPSRPALAPLYPLRTGDLKVFEGVSASCANQLWCMVWSDIVSWG
eukprot:m.92479 g.92479  ORF g.92479 m.92479 type:complete len:66 (-) comp14947_c0_seq2:1387-1584(-)